MGRAILATGILYLIERKHFKAFILNNDTHGPGFLSRSGILRGCGNGLATYPDAAMPAAPSVQPLTTKPEKLVATGIVLMLTPLTAGRHG
jgi:hypothetical protein